MSCKENDSKLNSYNVSLGWNRELIFQDIKENNVWETILDNGKTKQQITANHYLIFKAFCY